MDTPVFNQRGIEKELFTFDKEPQLPLTSLYQPTREDLLDSAITGAPQLMTAKEERVMFLRFNFAKRKLIALQNRVKRDGLTKETAELVVEWHRRFEHFREYLVRTNLALVLAMAKRVRLGDVDFAEVVSEGNMALIRAVDKIIVVTKERVRQIQNKALAKIKAVMEVGVLRTKTDAVAGEESEERLQRESAD